MLRPATGPSRRNVPHDCIMSHDIDHALKLPLKSFINTIIVRNPKCLKLTFFNASEEWISTVTNRANANWIVVDYTTIRVDATRARTRILASLLDACRIRAAICANHTFWPTRWRTTDIIWLTRTNSVIVNDTAVAVRTTRRWLTRTAWWRCCETGNQIGNAPRESFEDLVLLQPNQKWLVHQCW